MTSEHPAPIAATDTWHTVMAAAGHRCQCTGQCGQRHARTQGRCDHTHGGYAGGHTTRLLAAPADPAQLALPTHHLATLPAEALTAWCPACHDTARARAVRAARQATADRFADDSPALF